MATETTNQARESGRRQLSGGIVGGLIGVLRLILDIIGTIGLYILFGKRVAFSDRSHCIAGGLLLGLTAPLLVGLYLPLPPTEDRARVVIEWLFFGPFAGTLFGCLIWFLNSWADVYLRSSRSSSVEG